MTRLITDWIEDIEATIKDCEMDLINKTGLSYAELAAKAGGCSAADIRRASRENKIAVVPTTVGMGIIGSFAQSVAAIVGVMGFESFVTKHTDVNGLYEACQSQADIVFLADDDRFISINLNKRRMADNDTATALGYTAALEGAVGSLTGKEVLLLGCGRVGMELVKCLKAKGASLAVHDIDQDRLTTVKNEDVVSVQSPEEISKYRYIVDATSQGDWLHRDMLHPEAWIAALGIPLSLDHEACKTYADRLIHDPLQIGVASMLGLTL